MCGCLAITGSCMQGNFWKVLPLHVASQNSLSCGGAPLGSCALAVAVERSGVEGR